MNTVLLITLAALLLTLNFVPVFILLGALFPARLARTRELALGLSWRAFAIGMVNSLFFASVGLASFALAEKVDGILKVALMLPALLILVFLAVGLAFGLGGFVEAVGERVVPEAIPEAMAEAVPQNSGWKRTLWGTLLVGGSCAFPFFGWFVLLPYLGWVGIGAFIISFFRNPAANISKR